MKNKTNRILLMVVLTFSLILGLVQTTFAQSYEKDKKGSLTVTLADQGTELANVQLLLYKVGSIRDSEVILQYDLDKALSSSKVNFDELKTADDAIKAAETLAGLVGDSGITPMKQVTDSKGVVKFENLDQGMYLIVQEGTAKYGIVSPLLMSIPYSTDGNDWEYDVTIYPKAQKHEAKGSISVTKEIYYLNDDYELVPLTAVEDTYRVGLFCDAEGTVPYGSGSDYIKTIKLKGQHSNTVTYKNLPAGTYYIFELDLNGNPIKNGDFFDDEKNNMWTCQVNADGQEMEQKVELNLDSHPDAAVTVQNMTTNPDGYYVEAELNITKRVLENGEEITYDKPFYVSIFYQDENGNETLYKTRKLEQNGMINEKVPLLGDPIPEDTVIVVKETDKNGNPVDKSTFPFTVSGEGDITLVTTNIDPYEITLTNEANGEYSSTEPDSSEENSIEETTKPTTPPNKTRRVNTGDITSIGMWVGVIGLVAVIAIIVLVIKRRRDKR